MRLRHFIAGALLCAVAAGCDHVLQTEPVTTLPAQNAITDAPTALAALIGAYDGLQSLSYYGRTIQVLGDLSSDNARWNGTLQYYGDVDRNAIQADNTAIANLWTAIYADLARTNLVLQKVPDVSSLSTTDKNEILGEAYFLRALDLHNLTKLWGDVPMPLAPFTSAADAAAVTRTPQAQVYTQILADLAQAEQLISIPKQTARASLGAVRALRARVLLYKGDYQGALDATTAVLGMGYTLAPTYAELFAVDATGKTVSSTSEDIFRLTFTPSEYNEMGYYYLRAGRAEVQPTAGLNGAYEAGDVRKALTVAPSGSRFQGVKFPSTIGGDNLNILRLAEVILIRAEAYARLGQLANAVTEYNKIRVRAKLAPHVLGVDVTTQADVLAAIDKERRLELALEGDRWPDLVRTGRAAAVMGLDAAHAYQVLYPIPAVERTTAPGLTQNPGY